MYLNFYQLRKKPFSLAPDPEFLYLSQQHKDALGAIIYGIKEREGFVKVLGEVGTGKTTVIRSYLNSTYRKQILPVFIFNSKITFYELMQTFLSEIGIDPEGVHRSHTVNDMVRLAYQAMLEKTSQGKNIVLIIDEAQNMPIETLANLCILSNFETAKDKLIQIVLVGQPELQKKLDLYELRQLRQRVAYRALITPLSTKEGISYINHRLSLTSKGQRPIFTTRAISRILKHSKGVPRVINILCENSLIAGYGLQKKPVSLKLVKQVIAEYEGKQFSRQFPLKKVACSTLIIILTSLLVASYLPSSPRSFEEPMAEQLILIPLPDVSRELSKASKEEVLGPKPSTDSIEEKLALANLPDVLGELSKTSEEKDKSLRSQAGSISSLLSGRQISSEQSSRSKIVKQGDTVSKLFLETYGFYSTRALEWLKSHNPHIKNVDEIQIDQTIYFPEIEH